MYFQCVVVALQHNYGFLLIIIKKVHYFLDCLFIIIYLLDIVYYITIIL